MKKIFILLIAATVLLSSVSLAEDLSSLSDADLLVLYKRVTEELERRDIPAEALYPNVYSGSDLWDRDMAERLEEFFYCWHVSDIPNMLVVCSSDWKANEENPATELFRILSNRTPVDYTVLSVSGEPADSVRNVGLIVEIDRNNNQATAEYYFTVTMRREEDGLWYVDPRSLLTYDETADEPYAEQTPEPAEAPEISDNSVLYYCPEGGQYYHADRNCRRVNEKYLPLSGTFTYGELENEAYRDLQPCEICGAPARRENQSLPGSFSEAVDAAGEFVSVGGDIDYLAAAAEKDGKFIRMVTLLDDHAKELYMAVMTAEDAGDAFDAFQAYAWSLPVSYTEELTVEPKDQAEVDAQAGKTVGELAEEGYAFYSSGGGVNLPTAVDMTYGFFDYEFEIDASFEEYLEHEEWEGLKSMRVKSGKLSGFCSPATDLDWLADGTYEPQVVPHVTAEEAAAADSVPPLEEYSSKAWPLTAEGYSDLLNNTEARYGQVYMVEGVVHQVLSQSPLRAIINTGEDGKSQPVVVECPEQLSFSLETGDSCRMYADVSSACYILPVLTARHMFQAGTADQADGTSAGYGDEFIIPDIIPAKGIGDFIGEWQYCLIVNEDGSEMNREEMLAGGFTDEHAEMIITEDEIQLYAASLGDVGSVKCEFIPEDGTLRILNESDEPPVLCLTDNGMLFFFIPGSLSFGDMTAYLIRKEL